MQALILLILCLLPLLAIGAIVIIVLANRKPAKTCPYCAERIQPDAAICRYCGRDLAGTVAGHDVLGGPDTYVTDAPPDGPVDWEVEHGDEPAPGADPIGPDA